MTDRLSVLLHSEAAAIDVPPVPTGVLAAGRRQVRQRRARTVLVGAVATAIVAVGALAAVDRWSGGDDSIQPADRQAYQQQGAWISGDTVHVGDHQVRVQDAYGIGYTAAGAIVGSLPDQDLTLVTPDGRTRDLGRLRSIATEAGSSEVVFAESAGDHSWQLVTWDLVTDEREPLGEPFRTGTPMLALSGRYVVFLSGRRMMSMDRETGEVAHVPQQEIGFSTFQSFGPAGYLTTPDGDPDRISEWHLRSMPDGALVGSFPDDGIRYASVSPDGRYLVTGGAETTVVYDVASGERLPLEIDAPASSTGWTPDGHVLTTGGEGDTMTVCTPATGACTDTGARVDGNVFLEHGSYNDWPGSGSSASG